MHRFFLALLLWPCSAAHAQNSHKDTTNYNVRIKIPSAWMEKVMHFDYDRDNSGLLKEFGEIIQPEILNNPHAVHIDTGYGRVFNPMFVNLDGASAQEMVCMLGWDISTPYLTVFKKIDSQWYLLYLEEISTFYNAPDIGIANSFSKNKTFYFRHVDEHGSGIYIDSYSFYKLIDDKVYKCLELVNDANIYGWGLFMNQEIKMNFEFSGDEADALEVDYSYNFFPGAVKSGDCPWCANPDIPLIKGDNTARYEWDNRNKIYKFDPTSYDSTLDNLTAQKIACFGDFGNDKLFVKAFRKAIDEKLKEGTPEQKKLLKQYLVLVAKNGKAITEELEEKGNTGQTKFYGPKN